MLFVWDKGGNMTLFNFLKYIDNTAREYAIPVHSKYDAISCIQITDENDGQDKIMTVSNQGDLRLWTRDKGTFIKKFDIASIM